MSGLDTDVVVHRLLLKLDCKPVKQKLRRMQAMKIKEEVVKHYNARFLEVVIFWGGQ